MRFAILCVCIMGFAYPAAAETPIASRPVVTSAILQTRDGFVRSIAQSVLTTMRDKNATFLEKQAALQEMFVSVVDTDWIARFVMGKNWNVASDAQKTEYVGLYRTYLSNRYIAHFDKDSERSLKDIRVIGTSTADEDSFMVRTEMVMADSEPVRIDYLVHDTENSYRVIDIVVEGVSLLSTHRLEFTQLASSGGVENILSKLRQLVNTSQTTLAQAH